MRYLMNIFNINKVKEILLPSNTYFFHQTIQYNSKAFKNIKDDFKLSNRILSASEFEIFISM